LFSFNLFLSGLSRAVNSEWSASAEARIQICTKPVWNAATRTGFLRDVAMVTPGAVSSGEDFVTY
jgi:hypothetical protein